MTSEHLDVLVVTETWYNESSVLSDALPNGYSIHTANRQDKRGGGIAFIYNANLDVKFKQHDQFASFEHTTMLITNCTPKLRVTGIYRPPNASNCERFITDFTTMLEIYNTSSHASCLLGDFNIHVQNKIDNFAKAFDTTIHNFDLFQHVNESTHKFGNTLDLFITPSSIKENVSISVHDYGISDHYLVAAELALSAFKPKRNQIRTYRPLKNMDIDMFRYDLSQTTMFTSPSDDIEQFATQIEKCVVSILDKHAPVCSTNRAAPSERWQDEHVDKLKCLRRHFERKYRRTKLASDKRIYRLACRSTNAAIQNKHRTYFSERLNVCSVDGKSSWIAVNKLLADSRESIASSADNLQKLSCDLQSFFIEKVEKISLSIKNTAKDLNQSPQHHHFGDLFQQPLCTFQPVSASDVKHLILTSRQKSSGSDFIPTWLLVKCIDTLIEPITRLFNMSLSMGIFPSLFKSSQITPLLKKQGLDTSNYSNYRPISNLNFIGKVLEKIVLQQLQSHLESVPEFNKFQSAFKEHHSTETALVKITNDVLTAMDQKKSTILTLLDFSAAFDTIEHQILLDRLSLSYNISASALNWFSSYLSKRTQSVHIGSAMSTAAEVKYGVPQGSVLGPILFTLYTAPLSLIVSAHELHGHFYADDSQIYTSCKPSELPSTIIKLEACLSDISCWLSVNNLSLNAKKSELLVFGTKQCINKIETQPELHINDDTINTSTSSRDLGVWLDSQLNFEIHISKVCQSCYFQIRKLAHIRRYLTTRSAAVIGSAIIGSRLDYCNSLLYGITSSNLSRLQRVQNALARVVCRTPLRAHITPILKQLHWLPIKQRIHYKIALLTWKSLHYQKPSYLTDLIQQRSASHTRSLRNLNQLDIPRVSSHNGGRAFSSTACRIWNSLPSDVINATTFNTFKSRLKTHLFRLSYN